MRCGIPRLESQPAAAALERFGKSLKAATLGKTPRAYSGIGFENMAQFGEVFSPKRWELVESLKTSGPISIYALAKNLSRHYRNVHRDVSVLSEWLVVSKDENGRVFVPWGEIDVRMAPVKQAA